MSWLLRWWRERQAERRAVADFRHAWRALQRIRRGGNRLGPRRVA